VRGSPASSRSIRGLPWDGNAGWNNGNYLGYNTSAFGTPGGDRELILFVNLDEDNFTPARTRALNQVLFTALCNGVR
jgi:hypothetical protein